MAEKFFCTMRFFLKEKKFILYFAAGVVFSQIIARISSNPCHYSKKFVPV